MRLSIVVNMFNTAKYLPKCIHSILHQDIPAEDYEIILVDDCSTDNSLVLANAYAELYPNVRVCKHMQNKGLAAARNTGIDSAKGDYLCFVDSDDYLAENTTSILLRQMDDERLDMLRYNYQKVDEQYLFVPDSEKEASFDYSSCIMTGTEFLARRLGVACYVWSYIYRMDFIRSCGIRFYENCFFDDTPWLPLVLQKAQRVNTNAIRRQFYLQRSGSMVHSRERQAIIRKADTHMQLIELLLEQKKGSARQTYDWYEMMFTHSSLSVLTSVATIDYRLSLDYYSRLRSLGIFPLSESHLSKKSYRKIWMLNAFPKMSLFLISINNSY